MGNRRRRRGTVSYLAAEDFLGDMDVQDIPWSKPSGAPAALTTERVLIGEGRDGLEVALATAERAPKVDDVRRLWSQRWGRRAAPVTLVVAYPDGTGWKAAVCGTKDDPAVLTGLDLAQVERICAAALGAPDGAHADRTIHRLLVGQKDQLVPGLTNSGLFASHELRSGVPQRIDWANASQIGSALLAARGQDLIRGLGYTATPHGSTAHILAKDGANRAVAVLLEETELFDRPSNRFGAVSAVSQGLTVAQNQNLPWLIVVRGTQIRLYPAKMEVGVGRKGQAETFAEVDLALLADDEAAYLPLLFSADGLSDGGTVAQILAASEDHAAGLGKRLRERVYKDVVPDLAKAVAKRMQDSGEEDLAEAYHRTLIILFRLLFVAYAEDRGLLPYQRNHRYTKKALKTLAREFADNPDTRFDQDAVDRWEDLLAVWKAVDDGNTEWGVPPYNGGLFASDDLHPSGKAIASFRLSNAEIGPALRAMLVDFGDDGTVGPVDFRSLSVREFGTIYEGLLESSLSVAPHDLRIDPKTFNYVPANPGGVVDVSEGEIYFHNASGARKATGSYFTKAFAVEHLLQTSLEPALDQHLQRLEALLEAGDEAKVIQLFFDFRVADLAMGSGHFLVAAIDRIEVRFRAFLASHAGRLAPVNDELLRLAETARDQLQRLGIDTPDVEIEPSMLLRRQIARRCIYGLDLNLMAVELARLAIWIHTFVPGLPMSSLEHGLRVGNSLTGIATSDEVLEVLEPQSVPGQVSIFSEQVEVALSKAKERLTRAARTAEATKAEVHQSAQAHAKAMEDAADAKALFDAAIGVRLRVIGLPLGLEDALAAGRSDDVQKAVRELEAVHLPYLFPEVFLRQCPGFDVLLGNPPWEKVRHEPHQFWVIRDPGLRSLKGTKRNERINWLREHQPHVAAEEQVEIRRRERMRELLSRAYKLQASQHYDFAKVFAERNMMLVREGGSIGIVLPQPLLVLGGWGPIRERMINDFHLNAFPLRNRAEWLFDIHASTAVCLASLNSGSGVTVHAAADSLEAASAEQERQGLTMSVEELANLSDELNVPWFEHPEDPVVFMALATHPYLGSGDGWVTATADSTRWDFSGSGKHNEYGAEADSSGSWRVTMTRHVDAYLLTDDPDGKRVAEPSALAALSSGVSLVDDKPVLDKTHPPLVFRFPSRNDDSRTLIATALPASGWLFTKGYAHGVRFLQDPSDTDILALLGYLNSFPADWWARRFVDRHLGKRIISGLPLPEWTTAERGIVADLVATLLRRNGYSSLAGGRHLPVASSALDNLAIRARIDTLAAKGLGLSLQQAEIMFCDFEDTADALPERQRNAIRDQLNRDHG